MAISFATVSGVLIVVILLILILVLLLAGSLIGLAFSLLWLALTGLVIGALGRLVLPADKRSACSLRPWSGSPQASWAASWPTCSTSVGSSSSSLLSRSLQSG